MNKNYELKVENVRNQIIEAAQNYQRYLLGKVFLYIYEDRYIEMVYGKSAFLHLTGAKTYLSADDFFKKAVNGKLKTNQIFFDKTHPIRTATKKIKQFYDLEKLISQRVYIMENVKTQTILYGKGITDQRISIMLNKANNRYYFPQSLRVGGSKLFEENELYEVIYILSKSVDEENYSRVEYGAIKTLDKYIENNNISVNIKLSSNDF